MINRFPFARTALTAFLAVGLLSACSSTDESDDPAAATTPATETISVSGVQLYDYTYATCKDNVSITISFDASGGGSYLSAPANDAQCTTTDLTQKTELTLSNVQVVTDNTSTTYAIDPLGGISTAQQEHTLIVFSASAMTGTASAPCTTCQVYAYAVDDVLGTGYKALALTDLKTTASSSDNSTYLIQGQ